VIDVIESPKTTLSVSRMPRATAGRGRASMGLRADRISSRRVSTTVLRQQMRQQFSEWASASTAAPTSTSHQVLRGKTAIAHGRVSAITPTTQARAGPMTDQVNRCYFPSAVSPASACMA
jgi:hypothetical protein